VKAGEAGRHVFDDGEYVSLGKLRGCDRFNVFFGAAELTRVRQIPSLLGQGGARPPGPSIGPHIRVIYASRHPVDAFRYSSLEFLIPESR
jgi:hypothetical protein